MQTRSLILACTLAAMLAPASRVHAQSADGQEMANRIAAALKDSGQLTGYRVGVQYEDGVVWLHGTVSDKEQLQAAVELTQQVAGVDHVISKLEVVPAEQSRLTRPESATRETEPSLLLATMDIAAQTPVQAPQPAQVNQTGPAQALPAARTASHQLASGRAAERPTLAGRRSQRSAMPVPMGQAQAAAVRQASYAGTGGVQQAQCAPGYGGGMGGYEGVPGGSGYVPGATGGVAYENAQMPGYAWPSYAAYPNYAALTYPQQYSPTAWPYIGPFYPYPQVPLGWRRVTLEWDDGWWWLDFSHRKCH